MRTEIVRKTTTMFAAPCGLYTEVGSSLSIPSSIPLGIALSVTTSHWLLCLSRAADSKHLRWCDVPIIDKPLSTRYEEVSDIIHTNDMVMQRGNTCFWDGLISVTWSMQ